MDNDDQKKCKFNYIKKTGEFEMQDRKTPNNTNTGDILILIRTSKAS